MKGHSIQLRNYLKFYLSCNLKVPNTKNQCICHFSPSHQNELDRAAALLFFASRALISQNLLFFSLFENSGVSCIFTASCHYKSRQTINRPYFIAKLHDVQEQIEDFLAVLRKNLPLIASASRNKQPYQGMSSKLSCD